MELTSVYFHHLGYAHMHVEKMHKIIETRIIAGFFNAQLGLGIDSERDRVEPHNGTTQQTRDLNEAVVDDSELCGTH